MNDPTVEKKAMAAILEFAKGNPDAIRRRAIKPIEFRIFEVPATNRNRGTILNIIPDPETHGLTLTLIIGAHNQAMVKLKFLDLIETLNEIADSSPLIKRLMEGGKEEREKIEEEVGYTLSTNTFEIEDV